MSAKRTFVVTGANKGIGYGIVKLLAETVSGSVIYFTARNEALGKQSLSNLIASLGSNRKSTIILHKLDITDQKSIENFALHLKKEHEGLDVLINNAATAFKCNASEPAEVQARVTFSTNYYGTKMLCDILFPFMRNGGRVVNVCSKMGILTGRYSKEIVSRFVNPNLTVEDIDHILEEYEEACVRGDQIKKGFPESAYCLSKSALIALTFIQAKELAPRGITVNACCPGYVKTDMTSNKGNLTIEQGADTPVFLATCPKSNATGKFYSLREPVQWADQ